MEHIADSRKELMGEFHNEVVGFIEASPLTLTEVVIVLRMVSLAIERAFELSVKGK
jgi:hypothetical protein